MFPVLITDTGSWMWEPVGENMGHRYTKGVIMWWHNYLLCVSVTHIPYFPYISVVPRKDKVAMRKYLSPLSSVSWPVEKRHFKFLRTRCPYFLLYFVLYFLSPDQPFALCWHLAVCVLQKQEKEEANVRPVAKITHKGEIAIQEDLSDLTVTTVNARDNSSNPMVGFCAKLVKLIYVSKLP